MPILDPRAGYAAIWAISCFLFISIFTGGGFLVMYMVLPESDSTYWLGIAGVALVCLPWLFWLCTCFYRIISRFFGFRMLIGGRGGSVGGGGGNVGTDNGGDNNNNGEPNNSYQKGDNNEQESKEDSFRSRESEIPLRSSMGP